MNRTAIENRCPSRERVVGPTLSLFELTMGATVTQGLAIACRLELPDHLVGRPRSIAELAGLTDRPPAVIRRILLLLDALGIVAEDGGRYTLTEFGDPLRRDATPSLRGWTLMAGAGWFWGPLGRLDESLATGRSGFDLAEGRELFELLSGGTLPGARAEYDQAMGGAVVADGVELCTVVDLSDRRRLVDVGGGDGSLCLEVLAANGHLTGKVFDRPDVVNRWSARPHRAAERCVWEGGDFFDSVPADGDVYLLSRVLHDWDDERAGHLLRRVRTAMGGEGVLLVVEQLLGSDRRPFTPLCDLNMSALYGSGERTRESLDRLLRSAGFAVAEVTALPSGRFVIEAHPGRPSDRESLPEATR